jgi:hypothetical protein
MGTLLRRDVAGLAGNVMKNFDNKLASLAEWLEIATDGIAAAGKERITREIEAHFAEAVKAHLAQGESGPVAQINALDELGDAKTAQRNFRKRHLTREEEKRLVTLMGMARSKFVLATNLIIGLVESIDLACTNSKGGLLFCVPIFLGFIAFPIYAFCKLRRPGNAFQLSSMLAIQFFAVSPALGVILYSTGLNANRLLNIGYWMPLICVLLVWFAFGILAFQTWRKIRRNEKNPAIGI